MNAALKIIIDSSIGAYHNFIESVTNPLMHNNYFYLLLVISLACWGLEILFPWRKDQKLFRKDFWLDAFYMIFNLFLFYIAGYAALSNVGVNLFNDFLTLFDVQNIVVLKLYDSPKWLQYFTMFVVADFIHWNIHRLLHRVPFLWKFHKVHHSVKEMGFAAHLRFHWFESIFYKSIQYIPVAMIGFGLQDFFLMHIVTISLGHLNHSNLNLSYGPLKYIFNNPKMHIWHHAKNLPKGSSGVNFGISLSVWDYLFKTDYIPYSGKDIELGFDHLEDYPEKFGGQMIDPFK
ncbi:MAG: sterol desaturase/sphingolipid hydroxylase (fatty acid hydroxylase superfamily) [Saprospiraceae bacterium]|jgi:sterol desaturase/sphingolipid hydroxylase (fatty acid hydroxylase superfamily)